MTATITASGARAIARRWVETEGHRTPGFAGAFLHGSINWLAGDDPVPPTSDVDVILVTGGCSPSAKIGKLRVGGVLLDVSFLPEDELRSAEWVLGQYHLAGSFAGQSVIADPSGRLIALQTAVSRDYAKRHWVRRRCEHARDKVRHGYEAPEPESLPDGVMAHLFPAAVCCHVLLVAGLRNPTVRNRYVPTRELLREYGQFDIYEELLDLLGCTGLDAATVRRHFSAMVDAFEDAQAAPKPPVPFAADISAAGRPVAIDGSWQLIQAGDHREAVFWIAVTYSRCMRILATGGSNRPHERGYRALLADLGLGTYADRRQCRQRIVAALPSVWDVAEAIMERNVAIEA